MREEEGLREEKVWARERSSGRTGKDLPRECVKCASEPWAE